ncbi:MAG: TAXI family TRAP transporter solute-binding subunit [Magnetococcales bacterium]|nr:TAXI family TRAP transporter solute-binding subunit [Magnetococcales bacterium]
MNTGLKAGLFIGVMLLLFGCSASEEEIEALNAELESASRLNIALGEVEGVNYAGGTAICVALKKSGSSLPCKLMASEGYKQNILAVGAGQVDLALVRADSAYLAWHGKKPYKERNTKLRVLLSLHYEMVTLLTDSDSKILSFMQIPGNRINVGSKKANNGRLLSKLLRHCQIPSKTFSRKKSNLLPELLVKGEVDGGFDFSTHPSESLQILTDEKDLNFLPITGQCVENYVDEAPYMDFVNIPGGIYNGVAADIPTIGSKVWLVTHKDISDAVAYDVVKAIFSDIEQIRRKEPAFYRLSPRKMLGSFIIPYHVGAVQYFIEKGWYREGR